MYKVDNTENTTELMIQKIQKKNIDELNAKERKIIYTKI